MITSITKHSVDYWIPFPVISKYLTYKLFSVISVQFNLTITNVYVLKYKLIIIYINLGVFKQHSNQVLLLCRMALPNIILLIRVPGMLPAAVCVWTHLGIETWQFNE